MTVVFTRLFNPPTRSYFLLGPRGTGKTTWLGTHYPASVPRFDLLQPATYLRLERNPGLFTQEVEALPSDSLVIVDEVQKLPWLLDEVHALLAQPTNMKRFVLTGSSARKLKRKGANLLAGRASWRLFFPLIAAEHGTRSWDGLLRFGTLPEVLRAASDEERAEFLDAYALLYLKEEIQQEAAARDIHRFTRFVEVAALTHGQVTNVAALARDAGVARTTVVGYYGVLEDTLVGTWLRAWRPALRVKESQHPKFYFFDPGVVRALCGQQRLPLGNEEKGTLLEGYILHELRFWVQQHGWHAGLSYWRSPSGLEVDFVIERGDIRIGLEVKATERWRPHHGRALKQLIDQGFLHHGIGIYLGPRAQKADDLLVLPLGDFLKRLQDGTILAPGSTTGVP